MACGTPVVTSPFGALREVAGKVAVFIDPTDVSSIAEGMQCLLVDRQLRASLKEQGLERARQFDWKITAQKTRQLYWQVVTGLSNDSPDPIPAASPREQTRARS
jgi:glycosyltransferase involved in cell wall biosynthesis